MLTFQRSTVNTILSWNKIFQRNKPRLRRKNIQNENWKKLANEKINKIEKVGWNVRPTHPWPVDRWISGAGLDIT